MPKYIVKSNLQHDGKSYAPNDVVDLSEEQAEALSPEVIQPAPAKAEPPKTTK